MFQKAPCAGCDTREIGCHSNCDKYREWKSEKERIKSEYRKKHIKQSMFDSYVISSVKNMKSKRSGTNRNNRITGG